MWVATCMKISDMLKYLYWGTFEKYTCILVLAFITYTLCHRRNICCVSLGLNYFVFGTYMIRRETSERTLVLFLNVLTFKKVNHARSLVLITFLLASVVLLIFYKVQPCFNNCYVTSCSTCILRLVVKPFIGRFLICFTRFE